MERQDSIPMKDRHVRLRIPDKPGEVVDVSVTLIVALYVHTQRQTNRRVHALVPEMEDDSTAVDQVLRFEPKLRHRERIKPVIKAQPARPGTRFRREPLNTGTKLGESAYLDVQSHLERPVLQAVGGAVAAACGRSETKEPERAQVSLASVHMPLDRQQTVRPREDQQARVVCLVPLD